MGAIYRILFLAPIVVIGLLAVLSATPAQFECSGVQERRALQAIPEMTVDSFWNGSGFRQLDSFLSDHLALRSCLIKARVTVTEALFRKSSDNLIIGEGGQVFYRFIAEQYSLEGTQSFPLVQSIESFQRLKAHHRSQGKKFLFMNFRNKEFLLKDKLPSVWQGLLVNESELPFVKILKQLRGVGWTTLDFSPLMRKLREQGVLVYSPLEEHHPSPESYFHMLRKLVSRIAALQGVSVQPPKDFPKQRIPKLLNDELYLDHFFIRPDPSLKAPWTKIVDGVGPDGHTKGITFVYDGAEDAPLPRLVVYGDSNSMLMFDYFGKLFLPYFKSVVVHWNRVDLEGWDRAEMVMVNFTDQFSGAYKVCDALIASLDLAN